MAAVVAVVRRGGVGVAAARVAAAGVGAVPPVPVARRLVRLPVGAVVAPVSRVRVARLAMIAAVLAARAWAGASVGDLPLLALEAAVGAVTYWLAVLALRVPAYDDVLALVRRFLA